MPLVINSNIASLNSQRQLVKSGMEMDQAMSRLSSGKQINSAADDAAGLAISNRQTSQINGLNRAISNANDGVSMIQTAEGALDETTNILQRMRELSIQSANGIYSDADRTTLDAEVQQLKAEVDRIAETTAFNGQNVLDGSLGTVSLQIGSEANQTINFTLDDMTADGLGNAAGGDVVGATITDVATAIALVDGTAAGGTLTINGQSVGDLTGVTTMDGLLETMNAALSGVEVSAFTETIATADGDGVLIDGTDTLTLAVENTDDTTSTWVITGTNTLEGLAEKINTVTGGLLQASVNDDGRMVLAAENGVAITVTDAAAATGITSGTTYQPQLSFEITDSAVDNVDITLSDTTDAAAVTAQMTAWGLNNRSASDITGAEALDANDAALAEGDLNINGVDIGASALGASAAATQALVITQINALSDEHGVVASLSGTAALALNSVDGTEIEINMSGAATLLSTGLTETNNATSVGNSISDVDVSTQAGAQSAIDVIDVALEQINTSRSEMGAVSNRLDFTTSNLANIAENSSAARSRIVDADFAAETAALSRAQVLQQASTAMLAQANAAPQQVLSLLR